ncbi:MAG TPA: ABC transporter permease, partial [Thermoanaerobaculia bacterium]|nr:ABC transporter permease [Thermoanaerobaculia bacterium]
MTPTRRALGTLALLAPGAALLAFVLVWPVATLIARSFADPQGPFVFYARLIAVPTYVQILLRTLLYSFTTALICLAIGYPVAHKLATARPLARGVILACVLLPFWTNLLVRSYG